MTSLTSTIAEFRKGFEEQADAEIIDTMNAAAADLAATGIIDQSLKSGDIAPSFTLISHTGSEIQLSELLKKGKVIISFYRGGWCPYCNLELASLQQVLPEINAKNATLIAISPETPDYASLTHEKNELGFDILFDQGNEVANAFGLEFTLDERLRPIYQNFGLDVPAHNGEDTFKLPMPATYVINTDGKIGYHFIDPDYHKRLEPKDILSQL